MQLENIMLSPTKTILITIFLIIGVSLYFFGRSLWIPVYQKLFGKRTIAEAIGQYEADAQLRIRPYFEKTGTGYPPKKVVFLAMKTEQVLEVWALNENHYSFIYSYKIKKMSGKNGPKLNEGDRQVPEGKYKIVSLNPNSAYHLSMKLNYPNEFDLIHAKEGGRTQPGSNIFIHGKASSIGCLAMGDRVIEELFVLVENVGLNNVDVLIVPWDPRKKPLIYETHLSAPWVNELYRNIQAQFLTFIKQKPDR